MIRRIVTVVSLVAACVAAVVLTAATDETKGKAYKAEFDNAFGLTEGGDLRIGGVNAGQTTGFSVSDSEPPKAVVDFEITEPGFDSLREDAQCEVRQQSLIGEYYVDCQPGTSDQELPEGGTIPVEQTASIIPADLVNNVLRRPYRERFRLILAELGTGLAGRPEDLAATIRRAHPGLRETNEVLAILADQTQVLRDFVQDSDTVVEELAGNRRDVARFVREAGETAAISATRKQQLAEQWERLPVFLAELDPTMVRLGELADAQVPLLRDLRRASGDLERFFTELGPFSEATRPALRSLGRTGTVARSAMDESEEEIRELRRVAAGAGDVGTPLRQFLQTLDDRSRAIETDARAAETDPPAFDRESLDNRRNRGLNAQGFTGMESFLNYVYWQTLAINSFDEVGHLLRVLGVEVHDPDCSAYKVDPTKAEIAACRGYLGPKQPGVDRASGRVGDRTYTGENDPTRSGSSSTAAASSDRGSDRDRDSDGDGGGGSEPTAAAKGQSAEEPRGELPPEVQSLLDRKRPGARRSSDGPADAADRLLDDGGTRPQRGGGGAPDQLLDFLLGP